MKSKVLSIFSVLLCLTACEDNSVIFSPEVDNYALSCTELTLTTGESATLSVVKGESSTPVDAQIIWSSSDDDIATVKDGEVTGIHSGNATIFAKIDNLTLCCEVKVISKRRLVKSAVLTNGNFTFFYDTQSRLREIEIETSDSYLDKKVIIYGKVFIEYTANDKATMVFREIWEENGVETGGSRYEYELSFNADGKLTRAKNVLDESYSVGITYNPAGVLTGKSYFTDKYEWPQMVEGQHNLNYEYYSDGGIKSIWDGKDKLYEYTYAATTAPEYVNYFQTAAFDFGFVDFALNSIIGFPGGKLVSSETVGAGTERYTYEFDKDGYVTKIMADFSLNEGFPYHEYLYSKDYLFTYINADEASYERKNPYVYQGMGGKTYVINETDPQYYLSYYLVFLDDSRFYLLENEGDFQDIICGAYTQNGSTITMKLSGTEKDYITVGTVSGNTIQTEGGYFGEMSMTLTDNLIL